MTPWSNDECLEFWTWEREIDFVILSSSTVRHSWITRNIPDSRLHFLLFLVPDSVVDQRLRVHGRAHRYTVVVGVFRAHWLYEKLWNKREGNQSTKAAREVAFNAVTFWSDCEANLVWTTEMEMKSEKGWKEKFQWLKYDNKDGKQLLVMGSDHYLWKTEGLGVGQIKTSPCLVSRSWTLIGQDLSVPRTYGSKPTDWWSLCCYLLSYSVSSGPSRSWT